MDIPTKTNVELVTAYVTAPLLKRIREKVNDSVGEPAEVSHALALEPTKSPPMVADLYLVLRDKLSLAASETLQRLGARLKDGLPAALAKAPLRHQHFGLDTVDQMVAWLIQELTRMRTGRKTLASFQDALVGWEANFIGRILHERLVKHHPKLRVFFRQMGEEFVEMLNEEVRRTGSVTLRKPNGDTVKITTPFTNLRAAENTAIRGPTGPARAAPDFGFLADAEGFSVFIPIEIKLEAVMGRPQPRSRGSFPGSRQMAGHCWSPCMAPRSRKPFRVRRSCCLPTMAPASW